MKKRQKFGIMLSGLACAGMLSFSILPTQATEEPNPPCSHPSWHSEGDPESTGRYRGVWDGHYEQMRQIYRCNSCREEMEIIVDGDFSGHELTVYSGDPDGSWFEECDYCYYRFEH